MGRARSSRAARRCSRVSRPGCQASIGRVRQILPRSGTPRAADRERRPPGCGGRVPPGRNRGNAPARPAPCRNWGGGGLMRVPVRRLRHGQAQSPAPPARTRGDVADDFLAACHLRSPLAGARSWSCKLRSVKPSPQSCCQGDTDEQPLVAGRGRPGPHRRARPRRRRRRERRHVPVQGRCPEGQGPMALLSPDLKVLRAKAKRRARRHRARLV